MKATFFGTTTLLFDDGADQVLFDAHFTRPSLVRYIFGSGETNVRLTDELLRLHRVLARDRRLGSLPLLHLHSVHGGLLLRLLRAHGGYRSLVAPAGRGHRLGPLAPGDARKDAAHKTYDDSLLHGFISFGASPI